MVGRIDVRHPQTRRAVPPSFVAQGIYNKPHQLAGFLLDSTTGRIRLGLLSKHDSQTLRWDITFFNVPDGNYYLFIIDSHDQDWVRVEVTVRRSHGPTINYPGTGEDIPVDPTAYGTSNHTSISGTIVNENDANEVHPHQASTGPNARMNGFWTLTFADLTVAQNGSPTYKLTAVDNAPTTVTGLAVVS